MNTHADKSQEDKNPLVSNEASLKKLEQGSNSQFADNRPETMVQRKLQLMANTNAQIVQRQVYGNSDEIMPWDLLQTWIDEDIHELHTPTITRTANGPGGLGIDYDIEFAWPNTYFYDGHGYTVRTHLHVRNSAAVAPPGGGIWVTGLIGVGMNWNALAGHHYLRDFMERYIE